MEIKMVSWFSQFANPGLIGVVVVENDEGKVNAFIGSAVGFDEGREVEQIIKMGAKIEKEILESILELLKGQ